MLLAGWAPQYPDGLVCPRAAMAGLKLNDEPLLTRRASERWIQDSQTQGYARLAQP